jgi:endonuclease/exonuclease/phosphatase (EEP) superfamily protein YafD
MPFARAEVVLSGRPVASLYPQGMVTTPDRATGPVRRRSIILPRLLTAALWTQIAVFGVWALFRVVGFESVIPAVQLLAFTPYVALASLLPLIVAALSRRVWPALAAAMVMLVLASLVVPRWLADADTGPATAGGPALRVLSANLLVGGAQADTIVGLVRTNQVDLVAFQEFTTQAQAALERAGLTDLLPNRVAFPVDGVTGSALYSRYPLTNGAFHVHEASGFGQARATLTVPGASPIEVESAHPCPPSGWSRSHCWRADLVDQPAATVNGPVRLLMGDFNATLDHAALRRLIATGYRDAADVVGAGYSRTWPYDEKWYLPAVAIDHVLADRRVGVTEVSVHPVPNSDHRAVFAALQLPPA